AMAAQGGDELERPLDHGGEYPVVVVAVRLARQRQPVAEERLEATALVGAARERGRIEAGETPAQQGDQRSRAAESQVLCLLEDSDVADALGNRILIVAPGEREGALDQAEH